jgi:putative glutamine amidotransferase
MLQFLVKHATSKQPHKGNKQLMKPLRIAISANFMHPDRSRKAYPPKTIIYGEESLYHWFEDGGAIAYMIPRSSGKFRLEDVLADFDGVVFSGGADVCPKSYGEEPLRPEWSGDYARDQYELALFETARKLGKPILGICRGHQLINVALGGTLYQDTYTQLEGSELHRDGDIYDVFGHEISIADNSVLSEVCGGKLNQKINSVHHQAIKQLGQGLSVEARSTLDDVIEAVWFGDPAQYILGVQWHPEWMKDPQMLDPDLIRTHFLSACRAAQQL